VVTFSLAHLSDVHLGPLPPGAIFENFALKRIMGGMSWRFHRHKIHLPEIASAVRADILEAKPDHVAFTGDLINIASSAEFVQGATWLRDFGVGDFISFTPGNHDAYVPVKWEDGLAQFAPYMTSYKRQEFPFPFIRLRRNVALIGVNGACKQSLFRAGGTVGAEQRLRLSAALRSLQERGFYRVVMIHHPPAPGLSIPLRALTDAAELKEILETEGAELVLHGHNHERSITMLEGKGGQIPVIGVPSASMSANSHHDVAAWNRYDISRTKGKWHTTVSVRQWNADTKLMQDTDTFNLSSRA
jgi:3',5'-cyclic AMP phosphodiesterase CpdA